MDLPRLPAFGPALRSTLLLTLLLGCGDDVAPGASGAEPTGKLALPLETTTPTGARYRLVNAALDLTGTQTLSVVVPDGDATSHEVDLNEGPYQVLLRDGWELLRLDPSGAATAVEAELLSPNPQAFTITRATATVVPLRFRVPGGIVVMPRGTASFVIDVVESLCGLETPAGDVRCFDDWSSALFDLSAGIDVCLPAGSLSTPVGPANYCGSASCGPGMPGCAIHLGVQEGTMSFDRAGSTAGAQVALAPASAIIPIALPFPLGSCNLSVSTALPTLVSATSRVVPGADGTAAFERGTSSVDIPALQLAGCGTIAPILNLFESLLIDTLEDVASTAVADELARATQSLRCDLCSAGCGLVCAAAP